MSRGGRDTWMNVVTACRACNEKKSDRTPELAGMELLYLPYIPNRAEYLILTNRRIITIDEHTVVLHLVAPSAQIPYLLAEDTVGVQRQELEAAIAEEGSLWDPLPLTLPTYVNKARARRTVRTIELTGVKSSGHDDADTALATKADAADAEVPAETEAQRRKASGA